MAQPTATNPPTGEILDRHELASRTINQHGTYLAIFDDQQLGLLKRFVMDPSPENQRTILHELDGEDPQGLPEREIGRRAMRNGSLAGLVIARYGKVADDRHTFHPSEVEDLRRWFESTPGLLA